MFFSYFSTMEPSLASIKGRSLCGGCISFLPPYRTAILSMVYGPAGIRRPESRLAFPGQT